MPDLTEHRIRRELHSLARIPPRPVDDEAHAHLVANALVEPMAHPLDRFFPPPPWAKPAWWRLTPKGEGKLYATAPACGVEHCACHRPDDSLTAMHTKVRDAMQGAFLRPRSPV